MTRYPPATWKGDGRDSGAYIGVPFKLCWHTTETTSVPGYNDGGSAPHITYDTPKRRWYQHTDFKVAARSLRNEPGGVETNRAAVIQVEIVCYSAKSIADQSTARLWVGHLPDTAYQDLRAFAEWVMPVFGIKDAWPEKQALSFSQANAPGFRMTNLNWLNWNGQIGHQHIPENTHWDPGAINWDRLVVEMTPDEYRQIIREELDRGIDGRLATKFSRWGTQQAVHSVPIGKTGKTLGAMLHETWQARNTPVDSQAIAAAVVAALSPELRTAVAAELANLKMEATQ